MQLFTPYRRGLLAATVLVVFLSAGCGTTTVQPVALLEPATSTSGQRLTSDEDQHALALAHYGTALALSTEQSLSAALPEYLQAFQLDPHNLPLALWLAQTYRERHDPTNSFAIIETAIKNNPKSGEPWVAKGMTYQTLDDQPHATAAYRQALKVEPAHYGALRALIDIDIGDDNEDGVISQLDQAFHQRSDEEAYWAAVGDLYNRVIHQKPSWASRLDKNRIHIAYEKALALAPRDPDVLMRLGDSYVETANYKAAAETYTKLMEVRPNLPQLRERLAALYIKTDQKEKAIALYREIIKRDPVRFEFYNDLGSLYEEIEKPNDALNYYEQSLKLNANQPEVYLAISELQRSLKHNDEALKTLDEWKKKLPLDWRIPYVRAFIDTENKDFKRAVTDYADAENLATETPQEMPLRAQFYFGYGAACERSGDVQRAGPLFRKAIDLDPKFANAYNYLGYMWADNGTNLTEALSLIQKAIALEPDNGAFLDSLGWVNFKLGRTAEALTQLKRAVELLEKDDKKDADERRDDAVVYDHLAETYLKLGKQADAVQTWKHALTLDPANQDIAAKLQKYNSDHSDAPKK